MAEDNEEKIFVNRDSSKDVDFTEAVHQMRWIEAHESPLGIRVMDCRPIALNMVSGSAQRDIAEQYLVRREASGEEFRGKRPDDHIMVDCFLQYELTEWQPSEGTIYVSPEMEFKWDAYFYPFKSTFHEMFWARSWTGMLQYSVLVHMKDSSIVIPGIAAQRDACHNDAALAVRQVDFLIRSHLLNLPVPHPLPQDVSEDAEAIAAYSFSSYGRLGLFGSYEDTVECEPWYFWK